MPIFTNSNIELTLKFLTLFRYQPRNDGDSLIVKQSRQFKDNVKTWSITNSALQRIQEVIKAQELDAFFEGEITLVPIPSSSLIKEGTLRPPLEICNLLYKVRPNLEIIDCLKREKAIRKSSLGFKKRDRASVQEHLNSISLSDIFITTNKILLVDDVLTTGTTVISCAKIIKDRYPDSEIAIFSFLRPTKESESIRERIKLTQVICGTITLYNSLKVWIGDGDSEPSWN
jgi:hypothetical protein